MEEYFKQPAILLRMRQGLLGPYLDLLAKQLKEKGYTHETAQRHLSIVAGFSQWLEKKSVPIREICSQHIQKYMKARRQRKLGGVATALKAVLNVLHEQNAVAPRPTRIKRGSIDALNWKNMLDTYCKNVGCARRPCNTTRGSSNDF